MYEIILTVQSRFERRINDSIPTRVDLEDL
jgi:hypothetical protein